MGRAWRIADCLLHDLFGHTASCSKCRSSFRGDHAATLSHSRECRGRLNPHLDDDTEERTAKYVSDQVGRAVRSANLAKEKQFADPSDSGSYLPGGGTGSSDLFGSESHIGRAPKRILEDGDVGCNELPVLDASVSDSQTHNTAMRQRDFATINGATRDKHVLWTC